MQISAYRFLAIAIVSGGGSFFMQGDWPLVAWVAKLMAIFFGILGVLRLLNLWVDRYNRGGFRPIRWMHAMAFELIAVVGAILLKPFRRLGARRVAVGSTQNMPILLVHGYLHDATAWVYQQKQLARLGLGPIYTLNLQHPFRSIVAYAEQVRDKAHQIETETGKAHLILIGHSMGGLVSAWYATQLAHPSKVTDVITLGSPLSGTYLAKIGIGANAREMERYSVFLQELQEAIQKSSIRFFHVASTTDPIVPASSAILPTDPTRQAIFEDLGHVAMLFSPRVAKQIHSWIS